MKKKQRSKLYLQRLLKFKDQTIERKDYGIKIIDLLIISLSGAGIYVIFETLKFLLKPEAKEIGAEVIFLKVSGVVFALAISANFISQWTGHLANHHLDNSLEIQISKEKGDEIDKCELHDVEKKITFYNVLTHVLNIASTMLMVLGVSILGYFYLVTF